MLGLAKKYCESQIKSVLSLQEVKKAISFNGQKADTYEQEKKGKINKKKELNETPSKMNERFDWLKNKIDRHEQY